MQRLSLCLATLSLFINGFNHRALLLYPLGQKFSNYIASFGARGVYQEKKGITINPHHMLLFVSESAGCFNVTMINNDDRLYASNYIRWWSDGKSSRASAL